VDWVDVVVVLVSIDEGSNFEKSQMVCAHLATFCLEQEKLVEIDIMFEVVEFHASHECHCCLQWS
jgi:hypothetical protein